MTSFYHSRPERWPQFTLKGLLIATTVAAVLSATALPVAIDWLNAPPPSPYYQMDGGLILDPPPGPELMLSEEAAAVEAYNARMRAER